MESCFPTVLLLLTFTLCRTVIIERAGTPGKECYGTANGMSFSGSPQFRYDALRSRYTGCTVVNGNLELSALDDESLSYDLSFLSTIRVVTGYVLIDMVYAHTINLESLEIIGGDNLFQYLGKGYTLLVVLTTASDYSRGLRNLLLPSLTEISRGDVFFFGNPMLCYVNTIRWDRIFRRHNQTVQFKGDNTSRNRNCFPCSDTCTRAGVKRCWGPGRNNCQRDA